MALNSIDNLSHALVAVWLDHSKGALASSRLPSLGGNISVANDGVNSAIDGNLSTNIEIFQRKTWERNSLQKHALALLVPHLNSVVEWEEDKSEWANDISLLVIPFGFEDVSLFFDWFGEIHFEFSNIINYNLQINIYLKL